MADAKSGRSVSPLVKELFEAQQYPELRESPNGPPIRPYDVSGWTLPMQMGVQVAAVLQPLTQDQRAGFRRIEKFTPPAGKVEGAGPAYILSHQANAVFKVLNQIFAAGGRVSFSSSEIDMPGGKETGAIVVSDIDAARMSKIVHDNSLVAKAVAAVPRDVVAVKKPRLGLYRAWNPIIDEGWTRWILEQYEFAPVTLRNGDIQAGNLRHNFDAIILPDASPGLIRNGFGPGTVPGEFTGGVGEVGAIALREFVQDGGILIAFNDASLYAIQELGLPVKNVLAGLKPEEFYCSGSLLRVELQDTSHSPVWGLPPDPIVMFERGPAFDTIDGFRGRILAAYPKNQSPLMSGYLLHGDRIQGKAAALEVQYGKGRVYLFGFRPQWRGQSHGTYKFIFNAFYEAQGISKPGSAVPATKPTSSLH